jgi:hypothetical protein
LQEAAMNFGAAVTQIGTVGDPKNEGELAFGCRQMAEHALFMHLGLEVEPYKTNAGRLYRHWESLRQAPHRDNVLGAARQLRAFQIEVQKRLAAGEWLGWLYESFLAHITMELDLFVSHLTTSVTANDELCTQLKILRDHAAIVAHLLDPSEGLDIQSANGYAGQLGGLASTCRASNDQFLALSENAGKQLDAFLAANVAHARSTIHPVLLIHLQREGFRAQLAMSRVRSRESIRL